MVEYILDMYYPSGAGHRIKLCEKDWREIKSFMNPDVGYHNGKLPHDFTWIVRDQNGSVMVIKLKKCSMYKLWARKVSNPLNSDEHYEDPLS